MESTSNINISRFIPISPPDEIIGAHPITDDSRRTVIEGRQALIRILDRQDPRLFLVVGPCSIHDPEAAMEYASKLRNLAEEVSDTFLIAMRVYFEKPRTTLGWKGFINDPDLDDSFNIDKGLSQARKLLLDVTRLGLAAGTEALDPISPQYTSDLISWYAIGARTAESQTHRELASGLSSPVGFKNSTDGSIQVAVNAMTSARQSHRFLGITAKGQIAVFNTKGNAYGHIILRGGGGRPNYDSVSIRMATESLKRAQLPESIVVDCSHANSSKDHQLQPLVLEDCINQIITGNRSIVGFMLESFLGEGSQPITKEKKDLKYGVSVTDPCIDWETTEEIIRKARESLSGVMKMRQGQASCACGRED